MTNRVDQRRHPRIRRRFPVKLQVRGRSIPAVSEDLSPTGVLVHGPEIFQPGTAVSGTLNLAGEMLHFSAMVRWSRSASRLNSNETQSSMGLAFLSGPGSAYLEYLARASEELGGASAAPGGSAPARAAATNPRPPSAAAPPHTDKRTKTKPPLPPPPPPARSGLPPRLPENGAAPAVARPRSEGDRPREPGLAVGLIGKADSDARAADSKLRGTFPIAPSTAALLFERASVQAVTGTLPPGTQTVGVSMKLNLNRPPHVMAGSRLEAVATLVHIAPDRTLRFQVELREGERLIASGEHQRVLVVG